MRVKIIVMVQIVQLIKNIYFQKSECQCQKISICILYFSNYVKKIKKFRHTWCCGLKNENHQVIKGINWDCPNQSVQKKIYP